MTHPADYSFSKAFDQIAVSPQPTPPSAPGHDVLFYRTDEHLTRSVVDFLAAGVKAGQPLVVIATAAHRASFAAGLRARGIDLDELLNGHEAVWLDARETLDCFMEGTTPNGELFFETAKTVFDRLLRKRSYLVMRGYGEMVDLLWKDGNERAAIQLERLWNELAGTYAFSLLCGYAMDGFMYAAGTAACQRVCDHHSRILPYEPFRQIG